MSETFFDSIKNILLFIGVIAITFLLGLSAGYLIRTGDVREAQEHIHNATELLEQSRQRNREFAGRIGELEEVEHRQRLEIEGLGEEIRFLIEGTRRRDEIIGSLTESVETAGVHSKSIRELAEEGQRRVEEMLERYSENPD